MDPFPIYTASEGGNQQWGNAEAVASLTVEEIADRQHISRAIESPESFVKLLENPEASFIARLCVAETHVDALATKEVYVSHKQAIDIASNRSLLCSSACAYTTFYKNTDSASTLTSQFLAEREEVLALYHSRNSSLPERDAKKSEQSASRKNTIPVMSTYSWSGNIQHYIIEGLTQLMLFELFFLNKASNSDCRHKFEYYIPDNQFALDLAEILFGKQRVRKRKPSESHLFDQVIYLIPQQINFRPLLASSLVAIREIARRIKLHNTELQLSPSGNAYNPPNMTCFICRQPQTTNSTARCVENLEELQDIFSSKGVDVIHPELLTIEERIRVLSYYKTVILEDGASIMNTLFVNATKVLILAHPLFGHNQDFFRAFVSAALCIDPQLVSWHPGILEFEATVQELWARPDRFSVKYKINREAICSLLDTVCAS